MSDPEIAYRNTDYVGYSTTNIETYNMLKEENPEILEMDAYWPADEVISKCEVFVDLKEAQGLYNKAWTELQAK